MSKQAFQRSVLRSILPTFMGERPGQHPPTEDRAGWIAYWQARNQPWRTEPEIDTKRQKELARRRAIVPKIEQGIYPFRGMKLSRADVEWLLANHEDGRGPVDWNDEKQRNRNGIDVRGADLRQEDLRNLPLACMRGGLTWEEWESAIPERRTAAGVHLEEADLRWAHLEGAILTRAHLERGALRHAYLEQANLRSAYLERATFQGAHLEQATLRRAHLDRVSFVEAYLAGTDFRGAYLEGANFFKAHLEGVLKLEKKVPVELPPADLRGAFFDAVSHLEEATLGEKRFGFVSLADMHWGEANLAVVNWTVVNMLGDEFKARQLKEHDGKVKAKGHQVREYMEAVRANRQLATALQGQGLNEQAARFAYRAQMLQGVVFWRQRKIGSYLFSLFLDLMMGYGYRPERSFFAYLLVISGFAIAYYLLGHAVGPSLSPLGALVFSMTSFHGRGFFPGGIVLDDPLTVLAALEAFVGLLIEVTFIATLTRRLFGH